MFGIVGIKEDVGIGRRMYEGFGMLGEFFICSCIGSVGLVFIFITVLGGDVDYICFFFR